VPRLLVSVRSPAEALEALAGGAAIIDIKEPTQGPLGRADAAVWRSISAVLPATVSVSVALGELPEWRNLPDPDRHDFEGITFRKLGLAGVGPDWRSEWADLRERWSVGPTWIAVVYSDWLSAAAPSPADVLEEALTVEGCTGILVDTWDKSHPTRVEESWRPWFIRARRGGLKIALAGGLDESRIERLAPLAPDWFAVRGAACRAGEREGTIDSTRVARLVQRVQGLCRS